MESMSFVDAFLAIFFSFFFREDCALNLGNNCDGDPRRLVFAFFCDMQGMIKN